MPCVICGGLIDLLQLILGRIDTVGSVLSRVTGNVAEENGGIAHWERISHARNVTEKGLRLTEFAELTVGDQESAEGTKSIKSLVAMLLGGALVDGGTWNLCIATLDKPRLPQEVLQEITLVLGQEQHFGLLNDVSQVGDEVSAFWREFGGRIGQRFRSDGGVEGHVYLLVLVLGQRPTRGNGQPRLNKVLPMEACLSRKLRGEGLAVIFGGLDYPLGGRRRCRGGRKGMVS